MSDAVAVVWFATFSFSVNYTVPGQSWATFKFNKQLQLVLLNKNGLYGIH